MLPTLFHFFFSANLLLLGIKKNIYKIQHGERNKIKKEHICIGGCIQTDEKIRIHSENKPTSFTDTSRIHRRVAEFRMEIQCLRIARERVGSSWDWSEIINRGTRIELKSLGSLRERGSSRCKEGTLLLRTSR